MAKIGEGHAEAMLRKGAKEIAQALQAFPPGQQIQLNEEPGVFLNPTQQLVTQEMGGIEAYNAMLDAAATRAAPDQGHEKDVGLGH